MKSSVHSSRRGQLKVLLIALAACFANYSVAAEIQSDESKPFQRQSESVVRVMTWNIKVDSIFPPDGARQDSFIRIVRALEPDVIGLQEIFHGRADALAALMNNNIPLPEGQLWSVHVVADNALISRYPLKQQGGELVFPYPYPKLDAPDFQYGFATAFVDLPESISDRDLYVITMHNKSRLGDENVRLRQVQSDATVRWLRNLRVEGRPESMPVFTPIVVMGDMNVMPEASQQPYETLMSGDITDEQTFGPDLELDWDGTGLADALPSINGDEEYFFTWRIDDKGFPPTTLDRIFFTDSVMSIDQKFILDTTTISGSDLSALGLLYSDVLYDGAIGVYDHLPLFTDFVFHMEENVIEDR